MTSYENLNAAKEVRVSGIPVRSYRNKLVMKLNLPDVSGAGGIHFAFF